VLHPSDALVLVILIAVAFIMIVVRVVNFVLVNLVSHLVQVATVVFSRLLLMIVVIGALIALILLRI
jgi:hypothetical protein